MVVWKKFGQLFANKINLNRKKVLWNGFLYVFLPCFVLFWLITAYGYYRPAIKEYFLNKRAENFLERVEKQKQFYADLEKKDTSGGKTPEETLDLFVSALKRGDADLASKYYDVRVQKDALESLKKEFSLNGNYNNSIKYFEEVREKGRKVLYKDYKFQNRDGVAFVMTYILSEDRYVDVLGSEEKLLIKKGSEEKQSINFLINNINNIWKISEPI